jgi:EF hand
LLASINHACVSQCFGSLADDPAKVQVCLFETNARGDKNMQARGHQHVLVVMRLSRPPQAIADKAFGFFDKDKSGFISANEVSPAAERALQLLNLPAKPGMIESVFGRVAGEVYACRCLHRHAPTTVYDSTHRINHSCTTGGDGKLDKAEFQQMMAQLVAKAKTQAPAGAAA